SAARAPAPSSRSPQRSPAATFLARFIPASSLAPLRAPHAGDESQGAYQTCPRANSRPPGAGERRPAASHATVRRGGSGRRLFFPEHLCYSPEPHVGGHLHGV